MNFTIKIHFISQWIDLDLIQYMYLFLLTKGIPGLRGEQGDQGEKGKEVNKNK